MLPREFIACAWSPFKEELLVHWHKLTEEDLREAGRNRRALAKIIERKYGVAWQLAENYLLNLESNLSHSRAA